MDQVYDQVQNIPILSEDVVVDECIAYDGVHGDEFAMKHCTAYERDAPTTSDVPYMETDASVIYESI